MYGIDDLKSKIIVTEEKVVCPVNGCDVTVKRQRKAYQRHSDFCCKKHNIFISPTTFEYTEEMDNILWNNPTDISLLSEIRKHKRECRMTRDNSEDAVTWNVFKYLEKAGLLTGLLGTLTGQRQYKADIIYWSYSHQDKDNWPWLNKARCEFGEQLNRSSEPDIIVITDSTLFFIECKLSAGNNTTPSNAGAIKKYIMGGNEWFNKVFKSEYNNIAIGEKKYELLRFWLLGTWLAEQLNLNFYLTNLVPDRREIDIIERFSKHIREDESKKFVRISWESICQYIKDTAPEGKDKNTILNYFKNKTIGYNSRGELQPAFINK